MLYLVFDKFWGLAGSIVSFECYNRIFKRKYINGAALTKNFDYSDEFFQIVIEGLIVTLCIYVTGCKIIDVF